MRRLQRITARGVFVSLVLVAGTVVVVACDGGDTAAPATSATGTTAPTTVTTVVPTTAPATTSTTITTAPVTTTPATTAVTTTTPSTTVAPTTTVPAVDVDVRVYFLRDERLVIEHRDVAGPAVLRGAIEALLDGPDADEAAAGTGSAIPAGTELRSVDLDDGRATIDLTSEYGSGGGSMSMFARITQVVFTATQFDNVDEVVFWIDGAPVEALGGEGLVLIEPQTRAMTSRDLTGSVIIDTPRPGATVTNPVRVTGEGDVYEAQFPIEIWRDGVQIGGLAPVTAGAWGEWGDFDVTIPLDVGPGPIEIVAYDPGGCGDDPECPPIIRTIVEVELAS
jgi:spore germination protein GerM